MLTVVIFSNDWVTNKSLPEIALKFRKKKCNYAVKPCLILVSLGNNPATVSEYFKIITPPWYRSLNRLGTPEGSLTMACIMVSSSSKTSLSIDFRNKNCILAKDKNSDQITKSYIFSEMFEKVKGKKYLCYFSWIYPPYSSNLLKVAIHRSSSRFCFSLRCLPFFNISVNFSQPNRHRKNKLDFVIIVKTNATSPARPTRCCHYYHLGGINVVIVGAVYNIKSMPHRSGLLVDFCWLIFWLKREREKKNVLKCVA